MTQKDALDDILDDVSTKEIKVSNTQKSTKKYKPGVGVDVGTSFIVVTRQLEDGSFSSNHHRNMLYEMEVSEEANEILDKSTYFYIKSNNKYFVVGNDALSLSLAIGGKNKIIRPMNEGVINPSLKEGQDLLFLIIKAVTGDPVVASEPLRFSCPGQDIDSKVDNLFHKMILTSFFKKMGYDPKPINEAMCVMYDTGSTMKTPDGEIPLSGISMSWGAGQVNVALAFKGLSLIEFSCVKSGDNIDEMVEKVTGIEKSKIIKIKESKLDLLNVDYSDRIQSALSIYYDETIDRIIHNISKKFKERSGEMEGEIEIVVAGGTSMPNGFCERLNSSIESIDFPFKVYRVRHSKTPFFSVSQGACIRAMADYAKTNRKT